MMAAVPASRPINVKILIFSRSTWMPTTLDTSFESPMNSVCSPKRCRFRRNQSATTITAVQSACIGSCQSQGGPSTPSSGRPTIACHTVLSSAPRNA